MSEEPQNPLLTQPVNVINIGLESFAEDLRKQSVEVTQIAWTPPAGGNAELARLLSLLGS